MRFRSIISVGAALALTILPSCHKDKSSSSSTAPYLDGALSYSLPSYVLPGESFTLTPSGVSNPTNKGNVGYYWYSSWLTARDTTKTETGPGDGSWSVTVPLVIGDYSITCFAYATDYSPLNTIKKFSVVDPTVNTTLTGASYNTDSLTFKDSRDGSTYYLSTVGNKVWMQNNLYYDGLGVSYQNSPAIDAIFGRMYTWKEAMEACPSGWHLPSDAEFASLAGAAAKDEFSAGEEFTGAAGSLMADAYFLESKMWTYWPQVKITNQARFSAIPVGYAVDQEGIQKYSGINSYAAFWTSDSKGDDGMYRYIYVDKDNVYLSNGNKDSFRASVRCVKDR